MPSQPPPQCPRCRGTELQPRLLSNQTTQMDICPKCSGGWFDGRELTEVLSCAVDDLEIPEAAEHTSCVCPKCFIPLARIIYPETNVEVDVCDRCAGIWLDSGEFIAINRQRAAYQDRLKFEDDFPRPKNLKEAVVVFVERIVIRYADIG